MPSHKTFIFVMLSMLNVVLIAMTLILPDYTYILLCMLVWLDLIVYCGFQIQKRVFMFMFLLAFFIFLMGREILDTFGLHEVVTSFPKEVDIHAERLLIISLLSVFLGYVISDHIVLKGSKSRDINYESDMMHIYRKVSLHLFYGSMIFSAVRLVYSGFYILQYGYFATYTSESFGLPWAIEKLSDLTPIAFYLFLSTMPEKKQTDKHSRVYGIYLIMTLMSGKRFSFVAGFLILLAYYLKRNEINSGGVRWLKRRTIIITILVIPFLFVFLYIFGSIRFLNEVGDFSFKDAQTDFLYGQGVSIHVIKFTYMHEFNPDKIYSLSSTITFLQKNIISRVIGIKSYSGNTVNNALYGNSLGHALSYYIYGSRYLTGRGTGSCYIAEAFHDGGYVGVILWNLIYGVVLNRFFNFKKMGVFGCTISLLLLKSLLLAPRGSADGFVADIVDVTTWTAFLFVFFISRHIMSRRRFGGNEKGAMLASENSSTGGNQPL